MSFKRFLMLASFGISVLGMAGCSSSAPDLPPHVVADNSSLAPKDGRRIQINSSDPDLTEDQCVALVTGYQKKASPEGQVSVHKPSKVLKGTMAPWCVENFDGRGVVFNDNMF